MPADSPFYSRLSIRETLTAGADISVTVLMPRTVKHAIATTADNAWTTIRYTDVFFDVDIQT